MLSPIAILEVSLEGGLYLKPRSFIEADTRSVSGAPPFKVVSMRIAQSLRLLPYLGSDPSRQRLSPSLVWYVEALRGFPNNKVSRR